MVRLFDEDATQSGKGYDGLIDLVRLSSRLGFGVARPRKRPAEPLAEPAPEAVPAAAPGPVSEEDAAPAGQAPAPLDESLATVAAAAEARVAEDAPAEPPHLRVAYRAPAKTGQPRAAVSTSDFPRNLYAALSRKRITAIGFAPPEAIAIERCLTAQFSVVEAMGLFQTASDGGNLNHLDLLIVRVGEDPTAPDPAFVDTLLRRGFPVLVTGPRRLLSKLAHVHKRGVVDFVNEPWDSEELVWRSAGLLDRCPARRRRGQAERTRVLVADDDSASRTLLATAFDRCGMDCLEAEHGRAAIDVLKQEQPHAAILEVVMPGLDGFQVLAEVRRTPELATLPVAMLSLRQSESDVLRGFGLGADDYITKPFSPMEVAARVQRLVARVS